MAHERKEPSFNEDPLEAPTGQTSRIAGQWRQLLQLFDELDPDGKTALEQIAHVLIRAQNMRKGSG